MTEERPSQPFRVWLWIVLFMMTVATTILVGIHRQQLTRAERVFVGSWTGRYASTPDRPTTVYFQDDGTGDMGCWSVHDGHLLVHRKADTPWIERCWQRLVGATPDGFPMRIVSVADDHIILEGNERLELRRRVIRR